MYDAKQVFLNTQALPFQVGPPLGVVTEPAKDERAANAPRWKVRKIEGMTQGGFVEVFWTTATAQLVIDTLTMAKELSRVRMNYRILEMRKDALLDHTITLIEDGKSRHVAIQKVVFNLAPGPIRLTYVHRDGALDATLSDEGIAELLAASEKFGVKPYQYS